MRRSSISEVDADSPHNVLSPNAHPGNGQEASERRSALQRIPSHPVLDFANDMHVPEQVLFNKGSADMQYSFGAHSLLGSREKMEDRVIVEDLSDYEGLQPCSRAVFLAVLDGHAGNQAVDLLVSHLLPAVLSSSTLREQPLDALRSALMACEQELMEIECLSGSTALLALMVDRDLYLANVGDSRAVVCDDGQARQLTRDHKPLSNALERMRLESQGALLSEDGYVQLRSIGCECTDLGVSRALGGAHLKQAAQQALAQAQRLCSTSPPRDAYNPAGVGGTSASDTAGVGGTTSSGADAADVSRPANGTLSEDIGAAAAVMNGGMVGSPGGTGVTGHSTSGTGDGTGTSNGWHGTNGSHDVPHVLPAGPAGTHGDGGVVACPSPMVPSIANGRSGGRTLEECFASSNHSTFSTSATTTTAAAAAAVNNRGDGCSSMSTHQAIRLVAKGVLPPSALPSLPPWQLSPGPLQPLTIAGVLYDQSAFHLTLLQSHLLSPASSGGRHHSHGSSHRDSSLPPSSGKLANPPAADVPPGLHPVPLTPSGPMPVPLAALSGRSPPARRTMGVSPPQGINGGRMFSTSTSSASSFDGAEAMLSMSSHHVPPFVSAMAAPLSSGIVIPDPDLFHYAVTQDSEFLILACDGLWDMVQNSESTRMVRRWMSDGKTAAEAAELLSHNAIKRGSSDNVTTIVLRFSSRPITTSLGHSVLMRRTLTSTGSVSAPLNALRMQMQESDPEPSDGGSGFMSPA